MALKIRQARDELSELVKRAAYGDEEIRIGSHGREEASLIATKRLAEMRKEIARLRRRLAARLAGAEERPFAALQQALEAGAFGAGDAVRRRRAIPDLRTESGLSRGEQAALGARHSREPLYRRARPRA